MASGFVRRAAPFAALAALLLTVAVQAQDGPVVPPETPAPAESAEPEPTIASITSRLAAVDEVAELDDAQKAAIKALYREALEALTQSELATTRAAEFERATQEAPGLLDAIRKELSRPPDEPRPEVPADATAAQIQAAVASAEAELSAARERAEQLRAESSRRDERRQSLSEQLAKVRQRLLEAQESLAAPVPADERAELSAARRSRLLATRKAATEELRAAESELASYDARRDLLPARVDRARRRIGVAEKLVEAWQAIAGKRRRLEAEQATREAERLKREAARQTPLMNALAEGNQKLARLRSSDRGLTAKLAELTTELTRAKDRLAEMREQFRLERRKVEAAGLTNAMGMLLRKTYDGLPDVSALRRRIDERHEQISEVQFELIEHEEDRAKAGDIQRQVELFLAEVPAEAQATARPVAEELLTARRDLLDALVEEYKLTFERLIELDATNRQLIAATTEYRRYIEERILWVRSVSGSPTPDPVAAGEALSWLLSPAEWRFVLQRVSQGLPAVWVEALGWSLLALLLVPVGVWCRRRVTRSGEVVWRDPKDSFALTARALALTVAAALPLPVILWVLGELVAATPHQVEIGLAAAAGLRGAAATLLVLRIIRNLVRKGGVGETHFRWRRNSLALIRRHLRWYVPVAVSATFLVRAMAAQENHLWNDSLGRLAFVVGTVALAVFSQRVLRPQGALFAAYLQRNRGGWLDRLRLLWYPLAVGGPVALSLFALRGYYYSALQLAERLYGSLALVLALLLAQALFNRWLRLTRHRLIAQQAEADAAREAEATRAAEALAAHQAAAAKLAAEEAARSGDEGSPGEDPAADGESTPDSAAPPAPAPTSPHASGEFFAVEEEELDLTAINSQTQRLFRSAVAVSVLLGFYLIWAGALPALQRLEQIRVWPTIGLIEQVDEGSFAALEPGTVRPADAGAASSPAPTPNGSSGSSMPGIPGMGAAASPESASAEAPPAVVSLADLGLALIILGFTIVAAKNVPGLLEIMLLQRLPLDAGARYALSTVARYLIVVVGTSVGFGLVGISWSSVQWLAAALTFGLAFGLQEIFANFISGLIILFERPVRVGDVVTVGAVSGTVARIRIRATTIIDWDRKELIIPNKEFVTGQVINWTLTDPVIRVQIPVGIAYGSDVDRAIELLLEVASSHPATLADPSPSAFFVGFGDSCLNLEVRCFVPHVNEKLPVQHDLLRGVTHAFREAGIEIAFPQRDLHLRSADPLLNLFPPRGGGAVAVPLPASKVEVAARPEAKA